MFEGKDADNDDGQEYDESNKWNLIVIIYYVDFVFLLLLLLLLVVGLCFTACKHTDKRGDFSDQRLFGWCTYNRYVKKKKVNGHSERSRGDRYSLYFTTHTHVLLTSNHTWNPTKARQHFMLWPSLTGLLVSNQWPIIYLFLVLSTFLFMILCSRWK